MRGEIAMKFSFLATGRMLPDLKRLTSDYRFVDTVVEGNGAHAA
jgi:hypothetical protein